MKQDFIIIPTVTLALGLMAWGFVDHRHDTWPVKTDAARAVAHDPALKHFTEKSPYMRSER
jgi:hypothetical protein